LGYSYILDGKYPQAIEVLTQAIALNGANPKYHMNLGLAYFKNNDLEMAASAFQKIEDTAKRDKLLAQLGLLAYSNQAFNANESDTTVPTENQMDENNPVSWHKSDTAYTAESDQTGQDEGSRKENSELASAANASEEPAPSGVIVGSLNAVANESQPVKIDHQGAEVEISNGNGVRYMAKTVGKYLARKGVIVKRLTNADHFDHAETIIYYREGFFEKASQIQTLLPGPADERHNLVAADLGRHPIRILIGHDLIRFKSQMQGHVRIDIANGNGVNGMARRLGKYLREEGFKVGRLTNADHFNYNKTVVFYGKGHSEQAMKIASALPGNAKNELIELNHASSRIQVRLGSDLVF
jgi:tetratricopeptide (TPR) repeat protein